MPKLIKDKQVMDDTWELISDKTISTVDALPKGNLIVPLNVWQNCKADLINRGSIGVWLDSDEPPALLDGDTSSFSVIAINFPTFADGRGYSYATLLRQRYNFEGELRAIGDILRDQLFYMHRCGFDAFVMRENDKSEESLASLEDFKNTYQSSVSDPEPLFLRR